MVLVVASTRGSLTAIIQKPVSLKETGFLAMARVVASGWCPYLR